MTEEDENRGGEKQTRMEKETNEIQEEDGGGRNKRKLQIKYRKDSENYSSERKFNRIQTKNQSRNSDEG